MADLIAQLGAALDHAYLCEIDDRVAEGIMLENDSDPTQSFACILWRGQVASLQRRGFYIHLCRRGQTTLRWVDPRG